MKILLALLLVTSVARAQTLLPVPLVRQSTNYSCGAAALLAVLAYYGDLNWNETEIMEKAQTNTEGTDLGLLVDASNTIGLKSRWEDDTSLESIRKSLANGHPVIIEAQAWSDENYKSYAEVWDDGHFMVVVGLDAEKIYFVDPSHLGSHGYWTVTQFMDRWHDISAGNKRRQRTAMFFEGKPNPPAKLLPVP